MSADVKLAEAEALAKLLRPLLGAHADVTANHVLAAGYVPADRLAAVQAEKLRLQDEVDAARREVEELRAANAEEGVRALREAAEKQRRYRIGRNEVANWLDGLATTMLARAALANPPAKAES